MKKFFLLAISLICMQLAFAQDWNSRLISSNDNEIKVDVTVKGFDMINVVTPQGDAVVVTSEKMFKLAQAGEPDMPSIVIPAIIGDDALMNVQVADIQYVDYENINVAPSKGDFPRSIDPEDVPYTYGAMYQQDAFFPSEIAKLDEPYIHRDVRGQNMMIEPFAYNAVTKTLRVFTHFTIKMGKVGKDDRNVIVNRSKSMSIDPEFNKIYESRYINYAESMEKYTSIADNGELLIICHDAFMNAMEPFVAWKKQIGRPTTMVGTTTTGTTAAAIKAYLQTYYASHPNLTDILLVGDVAQIPGVYITAGSGNQNYSGYGDLQYGQLAGTDYYNEVIVGRFCCETEAQVVNHVNKVLNYERDLDETATWLTVGQGVSKNEGAGSGHYGESDFQHIDLIRDDLLAYNYTEVHRDYQSVTGVTSSAAIISQHINAGVSIINYCNHGNITLWGVFSYSNSQVNALTNDYKLPYIISVACLNGKYDNTGQPCFAEAWMRATNNSTGNPTGAIGGMFSYISQPWTPPQYGQDEMVDILVESQSNNIRRTMGGVSINGNLRVLDLGANQNANKGTYNNWILFGDPTMTLRNAVPQVMSVTSAPSMASTETSFTINATNADGALATLTLDGEIMGSATITGGTASISFDAPGRTGQATLTVFGYNKKTFINTVDITDGGTVTPLLVIAFAEPETIMLGESSTLTANASGGNPPYTYSWRPLGTIANPSASTTTVTPTETTTYTVTVSDGTNTATADVTVTVEEPQPVVCPKPRNLTVTNYWDEGEFGAHLSWDAATYEYALDRFEVYRSADNLDFKMVQRIVNTPSITHYECDDQVEAPGLYFYRVIAFYQNDCQSDYVSAEVEIHDYTGVGEDWTNNVLVYPNPTSGMVNIKAEAIQQISVVNMMGQVVMLQSVDTNEVMIDMSTFQSGVYLVNIITENGNVVKVLNVLR